MPINILGIETSCDETAIAVVTDGNRLRSNIIASQVHLHSQYGGVVPEVASRQHVRDLVPVLEQAVNDSGLKMEDLDVVSVTYGPGLAGSLITGLNAAKAISFSLNVPLIGVNHLEGHIYASWLGELDPGQDPGFPLACLIASGGHTDLLLMEGHGDYRLLGRTKDDAAGEAFDTAARILGMERREGARLSLLLSIPVIIGAGGLQGWALYQSGDARLTYDALLAAGLAFAAALIVMAGLMAWLKRSTFTPFVIYRIALGGFLLAVVYGWIG